MMLKPRSNCEFALTWTPTARTAIDPTEPPVTSTPDSTCRWRSKGLLSGRVAKTMDIPGASVVSPSDTTKISIVSARPLAISGALQMPPLARNVVDRDALATLQQMD